MTSAVGVSCNGVGSLLPARPPICYFARLRHDILHPTSWIGSGRWPSMTTKSSMAHHLVPHPGSEYHMPADVVDRLREEFPFVEVDREAGSDHVGDMITHFLRMKAGYERWKTPPPEAKELEQMIERLSRRRNEAVLVTVADDLSSEFGYVTFVVVPGEPLFFDCSCQQHEEAATSLVERIARNLNYTMKPI
jgi:hypothetical protein